LKEMYCSPPKTDAAFVCQLEEVLDVYKRPYDPKRPQCQARKKKSAETRLQKSLFAQRESPVAFLKVEHETMLAAK